MGGWIYKDYIHLAWHAHPTPPPPLQTHKPFFFFFGGGEQNVSTETFAKFHSKSTCQQVVLPGSPLPQLENASLDFLMRKFLMQNVFHRCQILEWALPQLSLCRHRNLHLKVNPAIFFSLYKATGMGWSSKADLGMGWSSKAALKIFILSRNVWYEMLDFYCPFSLSIRDDNYYYYFFLIDNEWEEGGKPSPV